MGLDLNYDEGQTPLDEDEKEGLLIHTITTKRDLDEFEQLNIEQAIQWTLSRNFKQKEILTEAFVKEVHKRMYNKVWAWSGEYRKSNENLGIDKWRIATELRTLLNDIIYWIENETYSPDEIAVRFKHRIVSIHCFANGNGRHSRLMADIIIEKIFNRPIFSWGAGKPVANGNTRIDYINAIKAADSGNFNLLLIFARS